MLKKWMLVVLFGATLAVPRGAEASPIALIMFDSVGNFTPVIFDGGPGDLDPTNGAIGVDLVLGDWTVNLLSTTGSPVLGPSTVSLNSLNASASTTTTLTILVTQLDNTALGMSAFEMSLDGVLINGAASFAAFFDTGNNGFGLTTPIGFLGTYLAGPTPLAIPGLAYGPVPGFGPYSLTLAYQIVGFGNGLTAFAGEGLVQPVPEPASLVLIGVGLVACWRARRARRLD